MSQINIVLLYGGRSGEHEVSCRSASSVEKHLDKNKYNITLIGICKNGLWYHQKDYTNNTDVLTIEEKEENLVSLIPGRGLFSQGKELSADFVFPVLHGTFGEDGTMQGLLEIMDLPYAGAGLDGSYTGMDKELAKVLWEKQGIAVVPYISVKKHNFIQEEERAAIKAQAEKELSYPLFIKPVQAGSSVGVSRVNTAEEFDAAMDNAFLYDTRLLIETAVDAREIECSVIGNEEPIAFTPGEIAPSHEFYDYEAKYTDPNGAELIIPANLSDEMKEKVKKEAIAAYRTLNIQGMSRVDFFLDKKTGELLINEVNTIPGFTSISMFSMLCAEDGLLYSDLLDKIIEYGFDKYKTRNSLHFSLTSQTVKS